MAERRFPIMSTGSDIAGCPRSIPWAMLTANEAQARDNHSQSLERLAERGGLDPTEALAILEGRRWRRMDIAEASARLRDLVVDYESAGSAIERHDNAVRLATIVEFQARTLEFTRAGEPLLLALEYAASDMAAEYKEVSDG